MRTQINFLKSYIGSGILGLPYAFYKGGVVVSYVTKTNMEQLSH